MVPIEKIFDHSEELLFIHVCSVRDTARRITKSSQLSSAPTAMREQHPGTTGCRIDLRDDDGAHASKLGLFEQTPRRAFANNIEAFLQGGGGWGASATRRMTASNQRRCPRNKVVTALQIDVLLWRRFLNSAVSPFRGSCSLNKINLGSQLWAFLWR